MQNAFECIRIHSNAFECIQMQILLLRYATRWWCIAFPRFIATMSTCGCISMLITKRQLFAFLTSVCEKTRLAIIQWTIRVFESQRHRFTHFAVTINCFIVCPFQRFTYWAYTLLVFCIIVFYRCERTLHKWWFCCCFYVFFLSTHWTNQWIQWIQWRRSPIWVLLFCYFFVNITWK